MSTQSIGCQANVNCVHGHKENLTTNRLFRDCFFEMRVGPRPRAFSDVKDGGGKNL